MNLSGTVLKGRYCILEPLGKGGGGKVYLARDVELGVLWAVKEVPGSGRNEARMLLKLSHIALPKMIDYVETGQGCYLVMEYIRGKSLGEYLKEGRYFSTEEIIKYAMEIAEVLEYLHSRKPPVYYGDLKPDNLMLSENGRLYLVDLGGAVNGYQERQKVCMGTEGFAAPEQYEGKMNAATDIYAFGKTLAALSGISLSGTLSEKQNHRKRRRNRNLSLVWLIFRCSRRRQKMRYQNVQIIQKKLNRIQKRQSQRSLRNILILVGSSIVVLLAVIFITTGSGTSASLRKDEFYRKLTIATDLYYQDKFEKGDAAERKRVCEQVDLRLRELQKECRKEEESRKVLEILAVNSEYQENYENAVFYYEQLLLYNEYYRIGYGEYGMFLIRTGQGEANQNLWRKYKSREKVLDDTDGRDLKLWEKEMAAIEEKS